MGVVAASGSNDSFSCTSILTTFGRLPCFHETLTVAHLDLQCPLQRRARPTRFFWFRKSPQTTCMDQNRIQLTSCAFTIARKDTQVKKHTQKILWLHCQ